MTTMETDRLVDDYLSRLEGPPRTCSDHDAQS